MPPRFLGGQYYILDITPLLSIRGIRGYLPCSWPTNQTVDRRAHLDLLAVKVDQPLPEVHPDRCLGLLGELPSTESVGEAGLPDTGVPDHDDFEYAGPRRRKSRARQRARKINRRPTLRHIRATAFSAAAAL